MASATSYPSPVTPQDSETDESLPSATMTKRKNTGGIVAPNMSTYTGGITASTGRGRPVPPVHKEEKKTKKRKASELADQETIEAGTTTDTIFTVECPVWPESKRYTARLSREDLYTEHEAPSTPGSTQLGINFAVKPGGAWSNLQRFKNAKCKFRSLRLQQLI